MTTAILALSILAGGPPLTKPVEHPFRVTDSAMIVDAVLNGKPTTYMFDTGFSGVIVMDAPIDIGKPDGTMTLRDFVGSFQAETVSVKSLELGPLKIDPTGMTVVKQPSGRMSESYNTHCDGIMGLEVIRNYVTEINFEKRKFIFYPDSYDISKRTPDNQKTFLAKMLPKGGNSMELEVKTKDGQSMYLALDTGNGFYATTHKDVLERVGIWKPGQEVEFMTQAMVASGAVESFYMLMPEVNIYGVPVKSSVWSIIDLPSSDAAHDGTVGFGFLKNFNITFDMKRRRVWLERWTDKVENEPVAEIGIGAFYDERSDRTIIYDVSPKSPADKAGIKPGDLLLGVDGEEPRELSFRALNQLFEGEKGSKVKLVTSRNGQILRYEVERNYLINGLPKSD